MRAKFSVALACLLPAGEFKNRERFAAMLKASTANFLAPAGRISVSIELFDCRPEGSGIFLVHRLATLSSFKARVVGVVMVGYRNASVLGSHRGQLGDAVTSDLGFVRMVKSVMSRTSGQLKCLSR